MKRLSNIPLIILTCVITVSCDMNKGGDPIPVPESPYISKVFDYSPAPGQFVNNMPVYSLGADQKAMTQMAARSIVGLKNGQLITLGGFGGSITFGFDHMVENKAGLRDFRIVANAFNNSPDPSVVGGSAEPGIVYVSYDANQNSLPDDEWYEIAGSEYSNSASIKNYQITYHRPLSEDVSADYIKWTDNQTNNGYISKNQFNHNSYYPAWLAAAQITFTGTRLPDNALDIYGDGTLIILQPYGRGYADNAPNDHPDSAIDIDWAVKSDGTPANLKGIHFVKVVSAIKQECANIGETSTEIAGAYDLHLLQENIVSQ